MGLVQIGRCHVERRPVTATGFYPEGNEEVLGRRIKESHLLIRLWRTVEIKSFKKLFQLSCVGQKSLIKTAYSEGSLSEAKEKTLAAFGNGWTLRGEGGGRVQVPGMGDWLTAWLHQREGAGGVSGLFIPVDG